MLTTFLGAHWTQLVQIQTVRRCAPATKTGLIARREVEELPEYNAVGSLFLIKNKNTKTKTFNFFAVAYVN